MAAMNISLPDALKAFIESRVKHDGYGNASEYFRELVRADQKRKQAEKLGFLLLEGLDCGEAQPLTKEDFAEIKRRGLERLKADKGK